MKLYAGTSGFSYKEWKGPFYPENLPDKDMLSFYSGELPSVEINNTFYRLPKAEMLESWAEQVPADFRFVLKASQRITHKKRLKEAESETEYLLKTTNALGDKLGAILFQLPPYLRKDTERLERFLEILPPSLRAAFEFRHETWFEEEVYECLRSHGCALCVADTEDSEREVVRTADWGYLRLRRPGYNDDELAKWAKDVARQNWTQAYVYFKHEDEGAGPRMARRFLKITEESIS